MKWDDKNGKMYPYNDDKRVSRIRASLLLLLLLL